MHHRYALALRHGGQRTVAGCARVDDRDLRTARLQIERGLVGAVVVREHDGVTPRQHAEAMDVRGHGAREHHTRQVVVAEHDRPLVRARCENDALGADLPQQLARALAHRDRQMIRQALRDGHEVVILIAERGTAREDTHVGQLAQLGFGLLDPLQRGLAVDFRAARQQAAAKLPLVVNQDDARPGHRRRVCGREPRRAATHDEHVAVRVTLVVAVRVAHVGRLAKAGRFANLFFVLRPHLARPHEGLVVETGGQEARKHLADRIAIVFERRFGVHAGGDEPLV